MGQDAPDSDGRDAAQGMEADRKTEEHGPAFQARKPRSVRHIRNKQGGEPSWRTMKAGLVHLETHLNSRKKQKECGEQRRAH